MKRDELAYLKAMRDAAARVEQYVQGMDEVSFKEQNMVQDAVIREFEVIGIIGRRDSLEMENARQQLRFRTITDIYEGLEQDFFNVDLQKVWVAATTEAGSLKTDITRLLGEPAN